MQRERGEGVEGHEIESIVSAKRLSFLARGGARRLRSPICCCPLRPSPDGSVCRHWDIVDNSKAFLVLPTCNNGRLCAPDPPQSFFICFAEYYPVTSRLRLAMQRRPSAAAAPSAAPAARAAAPRRMERSRGGRRHSSQARGQPARHGHVRGYATAQGGWAFAAANCGAAG